MGSLFSICTISSIHVTFCPLHAYILLITHTFPGKSDKESGTLATMDLPSASKLTLKDITQKKKKELKEPSMMHLAGT